MTGLRFPSLPLVFAFAYVKTQPARSRKKIMSNPPGQLRLSPATRAAQALRLIDAQTGAVVPGIDLATTFARDIYFNGRKECVTLYPPRLQPRSA